MKRDFLAGAWRLVIIVLVSAALLGGAYALTQPRIEEARRTADRERMGHVLEAHSYQGVQPSGGFVHTEIQEAFDALDAQGERIGQVYIVATKGYGGQVAFVIGVVEGRVTGIAVGDNGETPGVGSRALADEYLALYIGADLLAMQNQPVDALTGATITSDAVWRAVQVVAEQLGVG